MADYPSAINSPRTKVNRSGVVYDATKETVIFVEDIQNSDDEIVAIETELGTLPKGAYASVKDFLADLLSKVISVFTDIPDVPASYSGQGGKVVKVKSTEDGLEFGVGAGGGDMYKATYDTDNDGIVDNSEKLEGSTKAEVQTHAPQAHHLTHENGVGDEISVAGLSGELADNQPPKTHKTSHENGGGDEISVAGLSGELADNQKSTFLKLSDTPASYAGQSGKIVKVKSTEDQLEFGAGGGADFPMALKVAGVRWVCPGWISIGTSWPSISSGRLYYVPIFVPVTTTYIRIAIRVYTLGAGLARLGIYNWSNGVPNALVLDAGTVSVATTGIKEIVISQALTRGYYFLAVVANIGGNYYGPHSTYGFNAPVPGFATDGGGYFDKTNCYVDGRVGDVAGGLVSPGPAPTYGLIHSYAVVYLREN